MRNQIVRHGLSVLLLMSLVAGLNQPSVAQVQSGRLPDGPAPLKPVVADAVKFDLSPALRAMPALLPEEPAVWREIPNLSLWSGKDLSAAPETGEKDMALQSSPSAIDALPDPAMNFDGIQNTYGVAPPDTQGDIGYDPATGKKYYVQWVNLGFAIWDVTAGTPGSQSLVYGPVNGNTLWQGFGGDCQTTNHGDPITLYDPISHRWLMSQFAVNDPYYQCIAISQTGDPTGAWYRYAYEWKNGAGTATMNDYPKFGVWPDGFYMTANQFIGNTWAGTGAAVFERNQMLNGGPARMVYFDLGSGDWGGMLPSDLDGTATPPANSPNYFAEVHANEWSPDFSQDEVAIYAFHVDWANPVNSTFTSVTTLPMAAFDGNMCGGSRDCIQQPGTTQKLDAIADRTLYRLAYRSFGGYEALVSNLTVDANSSDQAGVRWFELHRSGGTWSIYQQGTFAPDSHNRWMGSIAQDHMGNLALGYSASSSSLYPSVRYTGHQAGDPLGSMQAEKVIFAGTASQSGVNRWGDYSMMGIDPQDDCTFWYTQEYSSGSWDWRTRIASIKFPNCTIGPSGTLAGTVRQAGTSNPIAGAIVQAMLSGNPAGTGVTNASGQFSFSLLTGAYDVTASAYGYQPVTVNGVAVTANNTTTQNFNLSLAGTYLVQGHVRDATTGWPLYAHITISGDPFNPPPSSSDLWTDPVTASYQVNLAGGVTYSFHVEAWVNGYVPKDQSVGPLAGNTTVELNLSADLESCSAPGYQLSGGLVEAFDAATPPELPSGWAEQVVDAGGYATPGWDTRTDTLHPSGQQPRSAPNLASFNSYDASPGASARLYRTAGLDMNALPSHTLSFWMYHDTGYNSSNDRVQAQVSTTGGVSWVDAGSPVSRYDGSTGWKKHSVDLSTYGTQASLRIGFLGLSEYGNDVHLDDVAIGTSCSSLPGGLVVGNVNDANTHLALAGAKVENDSGRSFTTQATPDPAVEDSFYTLFSPSGQHLFSAMFGTSYGPDTRQPNVLTGSTIRQDFSLPAAKLSLSTASLEVTLVSGQSTTRDITFNNEGNWPAQYNLVEVNAPYVPPAYGPFASAGRHLGPKNLYKTTLNGVPYYLNPPEGVTPLAAGDVLGSWDTGLGLTWGLGFNTRIDDLWVGNINDSSDYNFLPNGTGTGAKIDIASWVAEFGADMAYNPLTDRLWQVNVGGDNCIYEMDPGTRASTGRKICPAFGTAERGLAYDPTSDTFYAGSWNDSIINHFDANGQILDSVNVGLAIAGLAYNPSSGHLFVTPNAASGYDIYVLDAKNYYNILGGFDISGMGAYEQAGLEFDCNSHLWAANQGQNRVLEVDSGEGGVCDWWDIPWLSVSPANGTIPAGGSTLAHFNFNANGLSSGVYQAQVKVGNNTPYGSQIISVKLTVLGHGVSLEPSSASSSAPAGTHVLYELTVSNTGDVADTFNLSVSGASWITLLSQSSVHLAAGASTKITVTVTIPNGLPSGYSDDVTITATSQGDPSKTDSSIFTTTIVGYSLFLPSVSK